VVVRAVAVARVAVGLVAEAQVAVVVRAAVGQAEGRGAERERRKRRREGKIELNSGTCAAAGYRESNLELAMSGVPHRSSISLGTCGRCLNSHSLVCYNEPGMEDR